jgi:hypothetical protein
MFNAKPKLSKASKMPCRSWSLQALDTCPASIGTDGELVDACKGCYATDGNYRFSNVKAPRLHNREDWQQADWVDAMVAELDNDRYFRWFDSGDMYSLKLAEKIYAVMVATPWTRHWLPTRMHKFAKFADILAKMEALPNVVVRLSSDSINGDIIAGNTTSTIIPTISHRKPKMTICEAYEREGKCATCRACWDKDVEVVAYVAHGRKMAKQIKDLITTVEVV